MESNQPTNLSIVINGLRPFLGDYAEEYTALELSLINSQYVDVQHSPGGIQASFPTDLPHLATKDLLILLRNLHISLKIILGTVQTSKCIEHIKFDLFDDLLTRSQSFVRSSATAQVNT